MTLARLKNNSCVLLLMMTCIIIACNNKHKGPHIFEKLSASQTNVDFANNLTESNSLNIMDYLYFYNGAGVASGDFNNDGLEDIYFVSNQGSNKLYLNKGDLKFEDVTARAGVAGKGNWKTGVTIADINNDGLPDIYLSVVTGYKMFKGANQLYINNGDMTFTESAAKYGLDFKGLGTQASFFDYDKDGDLDAFILTHSVHSNDSYGDSTARFKYNYEAGDHLLRNDNGHFTDVTQKSGIYASGIGYGLGVSVSDLNNDGWDDIYVSNDFFEQDYYYLNQHDGTFKEQLKSAFGHTSLFSMGNSLTDVNKDGMLDVITTDMLPGDIKALRSSINDESLDIYNQEVRSGFHYQYSKNCLQLNVANGKKFIDIGLYAGVSATDWTWSPLSQDFDMDGYKDIFFSNGIKKRLTDLDYIKYLGDPAVVRVGTNRNFDQDKIDHMPDGRVHNYLYKGNADLKFEDVSESNDMNDITSAAGAVAVDLDNDGDLDIVTNNVNEAAFIYKNNSADKKDTRPKFLSFKTKFTGNNINGIGTKLYLRSQKSVDHQEFQTSTAFESSQSGKLLFTFSQGDTPKELLIVWPDNSYEVRTDFTFNKTSTLIYNNPKTVSTNRVDTVIANFIAGKSQFTYKPVIVSTLAKLNVNDVPDFNYAYLLPHTYLPHTPPIAVADVNGDGIDDIYAGGLSGDEKYILAGNGDSFKKIIINAFVPFKNTADAEASWADLNGDHLPDLVVISANHPFTANNELTEPRLFLNLGNFNFRYVPLPKIASQVAAVKFIDINNDKLPDILMQGSIPFRDYTAQRAAYLFVNKNDGKFEAAAEPTYKSLKNIQYVKDMVITDLNKDGWQDVVIAAEWQPLMVFINNKGTLQRKQIASIDKFKGWWQSVTITDIDGDGKPDLVAGNWGLNNKYNVDSETPLYAYNQDLDKDEKPDLILSYYHMGSYYPFRPKNDLEQELPYLKKEWLSYTKMADKTTGEIFGERLNKKIALSANAFKTIFVSDVLGKAAVQALPFLMQQSPVNNIYATNTTGKLLFNGNFWGVIPYEGKYDALGMATAQYNNKTKSFSAPQYWVNSQINFDDLADLQPLKTQSKKKWVAVTYDGKLVTISE